MYYIIMKISNIIKVVLFQNKQARNKSFFNAGFSDCSC